MLNEQAINAIQQSEATNSVARALDVASNCGHRVFLAPSNFNLHDIEKYMPVRRRARGVMETSDITSFAEYTATHQEKGCTVFVNADDMRATAVLNMGGPSEPGHADNLAQLKIKKTAALAALLTHATGASMSQGTAAEFLEDWSDQIKCFDENGASIPQNLAVAAIRKLTLDAARKVESTVKALSQSVSAFESVQASSADPIPVSLDFVTEPYHGLPPYTFQVRVGVLTSGEKPTITMRVRDMQGRIDSMARDFADLVRTAIAARTDQNSIPVSVGNYTPAK